MQQRLRKTVLLVTHDVDEALLLSDRVCIIERRSIASGADRHSVRRGRRSVSWRCAMPARTAGPGEPHARHPLLARASAGARHAAGPARAARRALDVVAAAIAVPLGIFAAHRPRLACATGRDRQCRADRAEPGDVRLPAAGAGASAASAHARRSSCSTLYALLPIVRTTIIGITGIDRRSERPASRSA